MYPPVKISDAFSAIANMMLNNYGEMFELEADDPNQLMLMKRDVSRFIRKLQYITLPMAAALQSSADFADTMEHSLMYHAHNFGNTDIISAFLPRISNKAPWFEVVMNAKMTPLQMFDGYTINLNLNR